MPLQSLFFINSNTENVLFSKYFGPCKDHHSFESSLQMHVNPYFQYLRKKAANASTAAEVEAAKESFTIMHEEEGLVHIVVTQAGEIYILACGTDDVDESILSDVTDCLREILQKLVDERFTEAALMQGETLGKLAIALDEMSPQGLIETMDAEFVIAKAKAKG